MDHVSPAQRVAPASEEREVSQAASPTAIRSARRAELLVGAANDPSEREADMAADEVMRRLAASAPMVGLGVPSSKRVQRSTASRASAPVVGPDGGPVPAELETRIRNAPRGVPMNAGVRTMMEGAFGADFGTVRIHRKSAIAPQIQAEAFTYGDDIHFAAAGPDPETAPGLHTLAHELGHVTQQGPSRIRRKIGFEFEDGTCKPWRGDCSTTRGAAATPPQHARPRPSTDVHSAHRAIRRMLLTPPVGSTQAPAQSQVTDNDNLNRRMRKGRWRPADTCAVDQVIVRMGFAGAAQQYEPVESGRLPESTSMSVPVETDPESVTRHWYLLFRLPQPAEGGKSQQEWAEIDQADLAELGLKDPGLVDEEEAARESSRRKEPLDPNKPVWMQIDMTKAGNVPEYRIIWKASPTGLAGRADYAGSCTLTVSRIRGAMQKLAATNALYVNPSRKPGDAPAGDLYSCHTFVRIINKELGLGIKIATVDTYMKKLDAGVPALSHAYQ